MKKLFGKRRSSPKAPSRDVNNQRNGPAATRVHWDSETVPANNVGATLSPRRSRSQKPIASGIKSEIPTLTELTLNGRDKRSSTRKGNSSGSRNNRKSELFSFTKPTLDTIPSNPGERLPSSKQKHLRGPESQWENTYGSKELSDPMWDYARWLKKMNPGFDVTYYPHGCKSGCPHHCPRCH